MSTWEGGKSIVENSLILLLTDLPCYENAFLDGIDEAPNGVLGNVCEIWFATAQEVRSRLAVEILHAIRNQERRSQRQCKTHPSCIQFPELAAPDQRLGNLFRDCGSRNKDRANDENDDSWSDKSDEDKSSSGDGLLRGERE